MYPSNPNVNENVAAGVPVGVTSHHYHQLRSTSENSWSSGLCDCHTDVPSCCLTCWCPWITFGQIAEIVDKGSSSCGTNGALYGLICYLTGWGWFYSCFYRIKLRRQYNLEETPCGDCLVHFCCEPCALCQEYRELKSRGFDMSLGVGWEENMERRNLEVPIAASAPTVEGGMKR